MTTIPYPLDAAVDLAKLGVGDVVTFLGPGERRRFMRGGITSAWGDGTYDVYAGGGTFHVRCDRASGDELTLESTAAQIEALGTSRDAARVAAGMVVPELNGPLRRLYTAALAAASGDDDEGRLLASDLMATIGKLLDFEVEIDLYRQA
jgi:hypothetical protein